MFGNLSMKTFSAFVTQWLFSGCCTLSIYLNFNRKAQLRLFILISLIISDSLVRLSISETFQGIMLLPQCSAQKGKNYHINHPNEQKQDEPWNASIRKLVNLA